MTIQDLINFLAAKSGVDADAITIHRIDMFFRRSDGTYFFMGEYWVKLLALVWFVL